MAWASGATGMAGGLFLFDYLLFYFEWVCTLMEWCVVMAASQGAELGDNQHGLHCTGSGLYSYSSTSFWWFFGWVVAGLRGGSGPKAGG